MNDVSLITTEGYSLENVTGKNQLCVQENINLKCPRTQTALFDYLRNVSSSLRNRIEFYKLYHTLAWTACDWI